MQATCRTYLKTFQDYCFRIFIGSTKNNLSVTSLIVWNDGKLTNLPFLGMENSLRIFSASPLIWKRSPEKGWSRSCMIEKVKPWSQYWLIAAGAYPGFCSMKRLGVFLLPLDGILVHHRSLPRNLLGLPQQFTGTHLYSWVERGTVRVKCLA